MVRFHSHSRCFYFKRKHEIDVAVDEYKTFFLFYGGMSRTSVFLDGTSTKHYFWIKLLLPDWLMLSYVGLECGLFCLKRCILRMFERFVWDAKITFVINVLFYTIFNRMKKRFQNLLIDHNECLIIEFTNLVRLQKGDN